MILTGEKRSTGGKPVPLPLSLPKIPYGLPWVWTLPSAGRGRQLTFLAASSVPDIVGIICVCDGGHRASYRNIVCL